MLTNNKRRELSMQALKAAIKVRNTLNLELFLPINIYDLVERLNVRILFVELKTIEGTYVKGKPPSIFISSLRPFGLQAFTCGHELGHHIFGHGDRIDEVVAWGSNQSEEFLVDCFSGHLIMPKTAVNQAFTARGWQPQNPEPEQVYVIAGMFGVGYATLLFHMNLSLNILSYQQSEALRKVQPKNIRQKIMGRSVSEDVFVVDEHWPTTQRSVDIQTGDYVVLPKGTLAEGGVLEYVEESDKGIVFQAIRSGRGRFLNSRLGWAAFTRVSRRGFTGLARYRHDIDEEFNNE